MVDCKPLASVINGHTALVGTDVRQILESTTSNLESIILNGCLPAGLWTDPVRWARREHNVVADYLCNYAMDHCTTWHHIFSVSLPDCFNVVFHSDGGARPHCGAASWIAEASYFDELAGTWVLKPIAISGVYYETPQSSFTAEALALYHCTNFLKIFSQNRRISRWAFDQ